MKIIWNLSFFIGRIRYFRLPEKFKYNILSIFGPNKCVIRSLICEKPEFSPRLTPTNGKKGRQYWYIMTQNLSTSPNIIAIYYCKYYYCISNKKTIESFHARKMVLYCAARSILEPEKLVSC